MYNLMLPTQLNAYGDVSFPDKCKWCEEGSIGKSVGIARKDGKSVGKKCFCYTCGKEEDYFEEQYEDIVDFGGETRKPQGEHSPAAKIITPVKIVTPKFVSPPTKVLEQNINEVNLSRYRVRNSLELTSDGTTEVMVFNCDVLSISQITHTTAILNKITTIIFTGESRRIESDKLFIMFPSLSKILLNSKKVSISTGLFVRYEECFSIADATTEESNGKIIISRSKKA